MQEQIDPLRLFGAIAGISSLAGLASLLRGGGKLGVVSILGTMLYSGILSLTIAMLCYDQLRDHPYMLVGLCTLSGLGGHTVADFLMQVFRGHGVNITFAAKQEEDKE